MTANTEPSKPTTSSIRNSFNGPLIFTVSVICISQIAYGFETQGYAAIQALDAFARQFGEFDDTQGVYYFPSTWLSMFNSFGLLGLLFGVVVGSVVSKRFGRRWCMFLMSLWGLVTATITITAATAEQIMVGRVLNFVYSGMELAVVPIFQAEVTPKAARGFVVGTYQLCLGIGGLLVNAVCYSTQHRTDKSAFQIPFGLYFVIPAFIACIVWFIPESPRWLAMQDRHEEALASLTRLRRGKFTEGEIDEEYQDVLATLEHERELAQSSGSSFPDLFRGANLLRTLIVFMVNFFLQATGQSFASQYGALFIKGLGTLNQFTMSMVATAINCFVSVASMFAVETLGRRKLLMTGAAVQAAALLTMGGLGTASTVTKQINVAIVAMMVVYLAGFTFGAAGVTYTLSAELPSARLRDMTFRAGSVVNIVTNFAVTFTLPYLLNADYANLQSKVGFIYGSVSVCLIVCTWLFVPDCRGRSLEDIDRLFESEYPARRFHKVSLEPLLIAGEDKNGDRLEAEIGNGGQRRDQ